MRGYCSVVDFRERARERRVLAIEDGFPRKRCHRPSFAWFLMSAVSLLLYFLPLSCFSSYRVLVSVSSLQSPDCSSQSILTCPGQAAVGYATITNIMLETFQRPP